VLKELGETEWAAWWGAVREVPDHGGETYKLNGLPWHFSEDVPDPLTEPAPLWRAQCPSIRRARLY
jgi:hypothetical protein